MLVGINLLTYLETEAASRLAWPLWMACVVLSALTFLLDFPTHDVPFCPWKV